MIKILGVHKYTISEVKNKIKSYFWGKKIKILDNNA